MVTAVSVKIVDKHGVFPWMRGLPRKIEKIGDRETYNLARFGAKAMKESAMNAGIKEWHNKMIKPIKAKRIRKGKHVIQIPWIVARLDIMPGHYVSLKRGRLITQWAQERFGTMKITGKSRVRYGPKGGIRGSIFVTRHRFIESGYRKTLNRLDIVANRIGNRIVS